MNYFILLGLNNILYIILIINKKVIIYIKIVYQ